MRPLAAACCWCLATAASACPECGHAIRREVRARIFDGSAALTAAQAAAPFAVLAGVAAAVRFWPRRGRGGRDA